MSGSVCALTPADHEKGISLGCPLSPLIGAFFLNALDQAAAKLRLFYIRFMDDILILAPPGPFAPGFLLTHHGGRVGRLRHYPMALELARLQRKAEARQAPPPLIPPANAVKEVRK